MGQADADTSLNSKGSVTERPRIVLAEDHPGMREEICHLLAPEFEVAGSVGDGQTLLLAVAQLKPDAVVSDIHMPVMDGIEASRRILQEGLCSAVIILTVYNDPQVVDIALESGIRGYVLKADAGEELALALHAVAGGGTYLSSGVRH
jgi:DNA-binding NarL/FixJ family response regulator